MNQVSQATTKVFFSVLRKTFAKGKARTVFIVAEKSMIKSLSTKHSRTRFHNLTCHLKNFFTIFLSTLDAFAPFKQIKTTILLLRKTLKIMKNHEKGRNCVISFKNLAQD